MGSLGFFHKISGILSNRVKRKTLFAKFISNSLFKNLEISSVVFSTKKNIGKTFKRIPGFPAVSESV